MNPWLARILIPVLAALMGAALGLLLGTRAQAPQLGLLLGALLGVAVVAMVDLTRGARVMRWLRGAQEDAAPRGNAFWGELGYRIERALRARERMASGERERLTQFLSAIEASPNGVMLLDASDQITWCSRVAADHFGIDPVRDRHQRITNLVRHPAFVAYVQQGDLGQPVEFTAPRGAGLLSVQLRPYGNGDKLMLSQDITESERAEAMRRDFVANVSHEIRTPLTVLAGYVESLSSLPLSVEERERVLAHMERQTQRMQSLVDDLLILAQLEGSPRPQPDRWIALDGLIAEAMAQAQALSGGRHRLQGPAATGVEWAGNASELLSAVTNLLSNAVRYTPDGGAVTLRWRVCVDGRGEIAVNDTGIGVAPEHLARLTERFYRVDGSRSRETGGTGLGLSIVKHVAQRHGGELVVRSEAGKGSTFSLMLPAARVRPAALASAKVDAPQGIDAALR